MIAVLLGALLTAVFAEAAHAVVTSLDAGRLNQTSAALVGLRVLAIDIAARARTHVHQFALAPDPATETMLSDIDAVYEDWGLPSQRNSCLNKAHGVR